MTAAAPHGRSSRVSNWLDHSISFLAPRYGLQRAQARIGLETVRKYEAAAMNRHTAGWTATGASVNDEVASGFERVRNRSREMVRNNEWANAAVRKKTTSLIGSGITVSPDLASERDLWNAWSGTTACDPEGRLNLPGLMRQSVHTWLPAGECLIRRRTRLIEDGLPVPLQLQVLEADYIDSTKTYVNDTNVCLLGVEYNKLGTRTAYWLFRNHPGDSIGMRTNQESVKVPAESVIHLFDASRPGQVRGMSELAVGLMRARKTGDYEFAIALRKQVEACFSAFVTTDDPQMTIGGVPLDPADTAKPRREKLGAGLISYLKSGEQVQFATPQASTGEDAFLTYQLRALAAGWGIPYEVLTGDLSKANFSSNRMGWVDYQQHTEELQWLVLVPQVIQPIRRWFREAAMLAGKPIGDKPDSITMPRKPWIKPTDDVTAIRDALSGGLTTFGEQLREQGWSSVDEFVQEASREQALFKAAGLKFDTMGGAGAAGKEKAVGKSGNQSDDDEEKTGDKKDADQE